MKYYPVYGEIEPKDDWLWPHPIDEKDRTEEGEGNKRNTGVGIFAKIGDEVVSPIDGIIIDKSNDSVVIQGNYRHAIQGIQVGVDKGEKVEAGEKIGLVAQPTSGKPEVWWSIFKNELRWENTIDPLRWTFNKLLKANDAVKLFKEDKLRVNPLKPTEKMDYPINVGGAWTHEGVMPLTVVRKKTDLSWIILLLAFGLVLMTKKK